MAATFEPVESAVAAAAHALGGAFSRPEPREGGLAPLLVVLDLDHTLVCSRDEVSSGFDFQLARGSQEAWVWKRPGLGLFLDWLRRPGVEVAVYTAGSAAYADGVAAHLDPEGTLIRHQLSRGDCVLEPPAKDLCKLHHDLRRTVLIDDSLLSFRLQPENGILVSAFLETSNADLELLRVQDLLETLLGAEDVREVLRPRLRLRERVRAQVFEARLDEQAARAVRVSGAGVATVNGRYLPRMGPSKCGRPVYVHMERPVHRILWSERGGCWVIDDGEAKEYRYAAAGRRDEDVPMGAAWTSCLEAGKLPVPIVTRSEEPWPWAPAAAAPAPAPAPCLLGSRVACRQPRGLQALPIPEKHPAAPLPDDVPMAALAMARVKGNAASLQDLYFGGAEAYAGCTQEDGRHLVALAAHAGA
mmetsp:Transcript_83149/g.235556  ORF Transcript_83149/g.235556 Transcript_83149/m.235556 type:complete len:416 (+) Transcript_83149:89-1336(+)